MRDWLLKSLHWMKENQEFVGDIRIRRGSVVETGTGLKAGKNEREINFQNHFVYPGLINAHDHLEMNLYPHLGTPPYRNYEAWAKDIYQPHKTPLREIERVNLKDRLMWGGVKNLISGVTTVVHHNPWHRLLGKNEFPVKVLKKIAWAHSLALGKDIQKAFPRKPDTPFIIHAGEGIDAMAFEEIQKLNDLGLLKKNSVLIHAVAMKESDIRLVSSRECSIVWCPSSNLLMFNQTAPIQQLKGRVKLALGSDSTLTGPATLLDEMKVALQTGLAGSREIYRMVTSAPGEIFKLTNPTLDPMEPANLFVAPIKHQNYFENLIQQLPRDIALVMVDGKIKLFDGEAGSRWNPLKYPLKVQGRLKYTYFDVSSLKKRIERKVGASILEENPLWKLIDA